MFRSRVPARLGALLAAAGLIATGQALTAGSAGAVGAFGAPQAVVPLPAGCDAIIADVSANADWTIHGFAQPVGEAAPCGDPRIQFIERSAAGVWTRTFSPYQGVLVASASDGVGTYLLWQAADGLRLARKNHGGAFGVSRLLSAASNQPLEGSVVATGGSWWAVWSEGRNPTPSQFRSYLYQAKTYGTDQGRTQISSTGADRDPKLALRPGGGAVMVWTRGIAGQDTAPTSIWVATNPNSGWASRQFSAGNDSHPVITTNGGATYIAWSRRCAGADVDSYAVERDNLGGSFSTHTFPGDCLANANFTRLVGIAASFAAPFAERTRLDLATAVLGPNQPFDYVSSRVKERYGFGTWTEATLSGSAGESPVDVVSTHGRTTVLTTGPTGLRSRTQP